MLIRSATVLPKKLERALLRIPGIDTVEAHASFCPLPGQSGEICIFVAARGAGGRPERQNDHLPAMIGETPSCLRPRRLRVPRRLTSQAKRRAAATARSATCSGAATFHVLL